MSGSFKFISFFLFLILAWILLAWLAAERLIVEKSLMHADAILVLGGSSTYIERTQKAAELYKKGIATKILLTNDGERAGWSQTEERNPPFVQLAKRNLIGQGVPAENIEIIPEEVAGTIDEAEILARKTQDNGWDAVLIVTSAYHTNRALWIFDKIFADNNVKTNIGIEPAMTGQQTPPPFVWWLSSDGWRLVAGEYVKFVYYWMYY